MTPSNLQGQMTTTAGATLSPQVPYRQSIVWFRRAKNFFFLENPRFGILEWSADHHIRLYAVDEPTNTVTSVEFAVPLQTLKSGSDTSQILFSLPGHVHYSCVFEEDAREVVFRSNITQIGSSLLGVVGHAYSLYIRIKQSKSGTTYQDTTDFGW